MKRQFEHNGSIFETDCDDQQAAEWEAHFARQRGVTSERRLAAQQAIPAMQRLTEILKCRSGQPYHLRAILFSLWNGKPVELTEILSFDWEIRKDLAQVLLAFGYEDDQVKFFYQAVEQTIRAAGQWDWFLEERHNIERLKERLKSLTEGKNLDLLEEFDRKIDAAAPGEVIEAYGKKWTVGRDHGPGTIWVASSSD